MLQLVAVLSESAFFSLPRVLEGESDLQASVLLASSLYYKQALQMLRNYLEGMVSQLYFLCSQSEFQAWKLGKNKYRSVRGESGLLASLTRDGVLSPDLCQLVSEVYGELNESVHGAERRLVNAGLFQGKHTGGTFAYSRFTEWAETFSKCAYFGIHALKISSDIWQLRGPQDKIFCEMCHNEDAAQFQVDKSEFKQSTWSFTCKRCGTQRDYSAEWAKRLGY